MDYDKILIAVGGNANKVPIPGIDGKNVFLLRTAADQEKIKKQAAESKTGVIIVGSGFIGSESAAALKKEYKGNLKVSMIGGEEFPLELCLGKEVGRMMHQQHTSNGVNLHMKAMVKQITHDSDGKANGVILSDGTKVEGDMVIVGAGVTPATKFLERTETGVKLDNRGGIICDPFLQSSNKDIFAAGDVCSFPYWQTGNRIRIEHWNNALEQGSHAAFNMLDKYVPFANVPFFWTRHYDKSIQYIGYTTSYDEVHITGDVSANKFLCYYIKDGKIAAVSGQGMANDLITLYECMSQGKLPEIGDIKDGSVTFEGLRK